MFFIAIKFRFCNIGIWCNGNTADSGPAFPGSSPGIPTQSIHLSQMDAFFVQLISLPYFFYVTLHKIGGIVPSASKTYLTEFNRFQYISIYI